MSAPPDIDVTGDGQGLSGDQTRDEDFLTARPTIWAKSVGLAVGRARKTVSISGMSMPWVNIRAGASKDGAISAG